MMTTGCGRDCTRMYLMLTLLVLTHGAVAGGSDTVAADAPPVFAGNDELRAYLLQAADRHPSLAALHAQWLAALERIPQVRALDDPMFTYKQFVRSDMKKFAVMFEQAFPWFGTLRLRGEKAAAEAEAARWQMYAERNRIFATIKKAYFDYSYLGEQIRLTEVQIEIIDYTTDIVSARYGLGLSPKDDLLRIQTESDKVADLRTQMLQMQPAMAARLNEALGRPLGDDIPWPQPAAFPPDPPLPPLLTAWIRLQSPELRAAESVIQTWEKEIGLARKMGRPQMRLGFEYERIKDQPSMRGTPLMPSKLMAGNNLFRTAAGIMPFDAVDTGLDVYELFLFKEPAEDREDDVAVSLSMSLPIWRKKVRGAVAEARYRADAARYEKETVARALEAAARMALFGIQDAQRRVQLYDQNLIPRAEQTFESLLAAYASGAPDADFLDVLGSIREWLDFQIERLRAVRDWQLAAADLESLLGGAWDSEPGALTQNEAAADDK